MYIPPSQKCEHFIDGMHLLLSYYTIECSQWPVGTFCKYNIRLGNLPYILWCAVICIQLIQSCYNDGEDISVLHVIIIIKSRVPCQPFPLLSDVSVVVCLRWLYCHILSAAVYLSLILTRSISYLHILSCNFRKCVACKIFFNISKF